MQTLQVDVGHTRYPISIGPALLTDAALLASQVRARDVLIVTNTTVAALYLETLRESLCAALPERCLVACILPDGERHKTLTTASQVWDALAGARMNRDSTIVALGGGVVGDIAGFAAACYQRGVDFVQVPTTLLAQVDSSVGGKTGVNHSAGKNLIGAFHQPIAVLCDTNTLGTLPDRELRAGLAEVIKYGCVWNAGFFDWLELNMSRLMSRDADTLAHAIGESCSIKAAVVALDERESNVRAILNFGHTFGHAIETATRFEEFLHGEAVALGMLMAADLSARLGLIDAALVMRLRRLLEQASLPVRTPRIGVETAAALMRMDKKVLGATVRLVLLQRLGQAIVSGDYDRRAFEATLVEYFG